MSESIVLIVVLLLALAAVVLFVMALLGVARDRHLEPVAKAVWVVVLMVAPVLGPIAWFVVSSQSTQARGTTR